MARGLGLTIILNLADVIELKDHHGSLAFFSNRMLAVRRSGMGGGQNPKIVFHVARLAAWNLLTYIDKP